MEYTPNGVKSLFYKQDFVNKDVAPAIKFGKTLDLYAKSKITITDNTLNNHTVLSIFAQISLGEDTRTFSNVYNRIMTHIADISIGNEKRAPKGKYVTSGLHLLV